MHDSRYEEIVPPLTDADQILANDLVYITYDLYQFGTWFLGWQVGKLETMLEEDGRFELKSYHYNEDAGTITFEVRVLGPDELDTKRRLQYEAGWKLLVLTAMVSSAVTMYCVVKTARWIAYRPISEAAKQAAMEAIDANPDLTPEQKESAKKSVQESGSDDGLSLNPLKPIGDVAKALFWLALALIAMAWLGKS